MLDEMGASKAWAALNERQRKVVAELGWGETEAEGDGAGGWDAGGEHPRWFSELGSADRRRANSIGLDALGWDTKKFVAREAAAGRGGSGGGMDWGRRVLGAVLLALAVAACAAASLAIRAGRAGGAAPAWWLDWVELSEEEREACTLYIYFPLLA